MTSLDFNQSINAPEESKPPSASEQSTDPPKCKRKKMRTIWKVIFYGGGAVILILGVLLTGFWHHLYRYLLASKLVLANSPYSQSYSTWTSDSVPIYFKVYLFNVTNPEGIVMRGDKPALEEVGPYVYRIRQLKDDIVWNDNSTVSFSDRRLWELVPELTRGSIHDKITSINAVALSLIYDCRKCSTIEKIVLNEVLKYNEKSPFVRYTIEDVLFKGADDKMLAMLAKLKKVIKPLQNLPDKFAWYFGKNMTEVNYYNMFTGKSDINKLGLLNSWNYKTSCRVYDGECDVVRGSIGEMWPMDGADQDKARLFISDFCSNFALQNVGPNTVHDVKGTKFEGTRDLFNVSSPEVACYCPGGQCEHKSGVRNVTACLNSPVFVSFPHFYEADKSFRDGVRGLNPRPDKHKFHLTLQKDSGIIIDVTARLQINVMVNKIPGFEFMPIPDVLLPVLWFEEYAEIPDHLVAQLQFTFNKLPFWFSTAGLILAIAGSILLVIGFIIMRFSLESIPYTRRLE